MSLNLRIRLSAMMFFQFFIWGAWVTVLSDYLKVIEKGDTGSLYGFFGPIYGLLGLASLFMPLIAGQVTDRTVATQKFLGVAHLAGAGGLLLAALTKDPKAIYIGMLIWSLAYAPTISLTNSLAFSHIKDPEKDYSLIRTFGTIGWIASNWILGLWRDSGMKIGGEDCLYLAAAAAVIMGLFCFILPHTPPAKSGVSPFAFARAFSLLLNLRILVFLIVSFVAATILWFYFPMIGPFLADLGVSAENSPKIQSLGPIFEILAMLSLPWLLKRYGPRKILILGMAAFAIRNLVFVIGWPTWLVAASCALHGPSFAFFFVVGFIFIDAAAPKDIKGSAQGLLGLVVFGLGAWLGTMIAFKVKAFYTVTAEATAAGAATEVVQWSRFFLVPMILAVVCAAVFMLTFPKGSMKDAAGKPEAAAAEGEKPASQPLA